MPRHARLDSRGILHHAIIRGIDRGKIVRDGKEREEFVRRLGETATKTLAASLWSGVYRAQDQTGGLRGECGDE
jgi:hypothetical protein